MPNQSRPKARMSRALGIALTPKCAKYLDARPYPPGEHGRKRRVTSDYAIRLREKQRLRAQYDLGEKQLRNAFDAAQRSGRRTGEALLADLETRLDAVVLRAGFARTIYQARQVVTHRHVLVDGARVDKPSFRVRPGQTVEITEKSRAKAPFLVAASGAHGDTPPPYLDVALSSLRAVLTRTPERAEIPVVCEEQLVVEYYAR